MGSATTAYRATSICGQHPISPCKINHNSIRKVMGPLNISTTSTHYSYNENTATRKVNLHFDVGDYRFQRTDCNTTFDMITKLTFSPQNNINAVKNDAKLKSCILTRQQPLQVNNYTPKLKFLSAKPRANYRSAKKPIIDGCICTTHRLIYQSYGFEHAPSLNTPWVRPVACSSKEYNIV